MAEQPKITRFDALGILLMGAAARFGAPVAALLLQLAALAAGVLGVLAIIRSRPIAAIALFPVAWVCWWFGDRVRSFAREQPLNQMLEKPPIEHDKPS